MSAQPQQSEKGFTEAVLQYARVNGWLCAHFNDSRRQVRPGVFVGDKDAAGFPDLCMTRTTRKAGTWNVSEARILFVELKVGKNRTTEKQDEWLSALNSAGARMGSTYQAGQCRAGVQVFVWTPEDWTEIERELGKWQP